MRPTRLALFLGRTFGKVAGVPEQDLSVGAGRDEGIAAGAEVDPPDAIAVATQGEDLMAGGDVRRAGRSRPSPRSPAGGRRG